MNDRAPLLVERHGAVETILINDAPWNRMSAAFIDALQAEIERIADDDSVRAVVIRGAGDEHFSVGMDLKQLEAGLAAAGGLDAFFDQRLAVLERIERLGKPVIAVLCGYCLGGGLELPLACHFRLAAAEGTKLGLPELDLGTVPAWGGSARLVRVVGRAHALDMILRSRMVDGTEAHRIGLITEVWPKAELFDRAQALATQLAERPALAVRQMLQCLVEHDTTPLADGLEAERRSVKATYRTPDMLEGMRAFAEKRKPRFNGG